MASRSSPRILNFYSLNGQKFNPDIPCVVSKVEHRTVAIHGRTGIHNFNTIDIHHATLLMDMGAADKDQTLSCGGGCFGFRHVRR